MLLVETKMLDGTVLHRQTDELDAYHAVGYAIEFGLVEPELVESVSCSDGVTDVVARPYGDNLAHVLPQGRTRGVGGPRMSRVMPTPTPLFFQVPWDALDAVMRAHSYAIGPDFLCFETFYQAVAATWPKDFTVIDIGGAYGTQGWLFRDFKRYVCVDSYELKPKDESVGGRCELPSNGLHVVADGSIYLSFYKHFKVDQSHDLFLCSAVPNKKLREMVLEMPNSIVWYPGEPMMGAGTHAAETIAEFERLKSSDWREMADGAVWSAIERRGLLEM